jgi:hypothetical protein
MIESIDTDQIMTVIISATSGGGITWLFRQVRKNTKAMDIIFRKHRLLLNHLCVEEIDGRIIPRDSTKDSSKLP